MGAIIRTWLAFAAVGTGLIHIALVIGAPLPLGIVLGTLGLAEFGWGVLTFANEKLFAPRVALVVALVPVAAWTVLLLASSLGATPAFAESFGLLPPAVTSLFELAGAAILGRHLGRRSDPDARAPFPGIGRYLLGLAAGVLVVAALTTPALAATQAGEFVAPSGTPDELFDLPGHGH